MKHEENRPSLPFTLSAENAPSPAGLIDYFGHNEKSIRGQLYEYGAVLFRGFEVVDSGSFGEVAARMAGPLLDYRGGVARRHQVGKSVYNSTEMPADRRLALHNEKSYSASHPDLVVFCCVIPAATGGATPLADGRRVWQRLSKPLQDAFAARRITFIQNLHAGAGEKKSWMWTYETEDRAEVEKFLISIDAKFHWKPNGALHTEETLSPVKVHPVTGVKALFSPVDTWYLDAGKFGGGRDGARRASEEFYQYCRFEDGDEIEPWMVIEVKSAIEAETREFPWHRGDVILIDNRLALHGRAPFTGDRSVLVAIGNDRQRH